MTLSMNKEEQFQSLLKDDRYQIFLFASRAVLPFSFASHPWLVVNKKGRISRFGIAAKKDISTKHIFGTIDDQENWGHIHKNKFPPFHGIWISPFSKKHFWKPKLMSFIEGGDNSLAERMATFIESSGTTYPFKERYSIFGPNSNTYVQWILNHFPESGMRLPWNSFGRNASGNTLVHRA